MKITRTRTQIKELKNTRLSLPLSLSIMPTTSNHHHHQQPTKANNNLNSTQPPKANRHHHRGTKES